MIDYNEIKWRCSTCPVYFKDLPDGTYNQAIYIENEYHKKMNRYLRRWGWWLQRMVFNRYKHGFCDLVYLPNQSKRLKQREYLLYHFPYMSEKLLQNIPDIKTEDLLSHLDDPDDARFLKPGFLFYHGKKDNGLLVYEYYPLVGLDNKALSYKTQIAEILKTHEENVKKHRQSVEVRGIGHAGLYSTQYKHDEDYADNMFGSLKNQVWEQLHLFKKQVLELQKSGVPLSVLEKILHQDDKLSKLIITKDYRLFLPEYNNMEIKMEPLNKAIYLLFLRHPEGIIFKHLPDYRKELTKIYADMKPYGINDRVLKSIEDVTNPCLNSINEKCSRIRGAFVSQFDDELAKNYYIYGHRGEPKKISLPQEMIEWEE